MTPYWSNGIADLYHTDARQVPLADKSVHCCVTSPPYYALRVYQDNDNRGIGLESSVEAYLDSMMEVMGEVWRVLRDDGVCWVNLGDSYGGSGKGQNGDGTHAAKHGEKQHTSAGTLTGGLPANRDMFGQLLLIPSRFALRMQQQGWILRQEVIWDKSAPMPESLAGTRWERCRVQQIVDGIIEWQPCPGCPKCEANEGLVLRRGSWRCTESFERIFMFVKQMGYWSDGEAVKLPAQYGRRDWNGHVHFKGGDLNVGHSGTTTGSNPETGANRRSVWKDIKPEPYGGSHFATFPSSLPRICIQASTSEAGCCPHCGAQWARVLERDTALAESRRGDEDYQSGELTNGKRFASATPGVSIKSNTLGWRPTCQCPEHKPIPATAFDPFGGTGTTCLAAQRLGRRSYMTDLSESYLQQAIKRLSGATLPLGL